MERKKIEIIITVILALVFGLLIVRSFKLFKKVQKSKDIVSNVSMPVNTASDKTIPEQEAKAAVVQSVSYPNLSEDNSLEWGRCPFSGKQYGAVIETQTVIVQKPIPLSLGGIIWDSASPKALINDEIVQPGYMIGQYTVKEIKQDRVILNDGNKDIELTLQY
jgi:hypothetical protein